MSRPFAGCSNAEPAEAPIPVRARLKNPVRIGPRFAGVHFPPVSMLPDARSRASLSVLGKRNPWPYSTWAKPKSRGDWGAPIAASCGGWLFPQPAMTRSSETTSWVPMPGRALPSRRPRQGLPRASRSGARRGPREPQCSPGGRPPRHRRQR
jgi:hypothetical protein